MTDTAKTEGIKVPPTCCFIPEEQQAEARRRSAQRQSVDEAILKHINSCSLGCGVDYQKGRCADGDRLFDEQDALIALERAAPLHCLKAAEWHIQDVGASYDDYTYGCSDHVGHLLSDAPAHTITPYQE